MKMLWWMRCRCAYIRARYTLSRTHTHMHTIAAWKLWMERKQKKRTLTRCILLLVALKSVCNNRAMVSGYAAHGAYEKLKRKNNNNQQKRKLKTVITLREDDGSTLLHFFLEKNYTAKQRYNKSTFDLWSACSRLKWDCEDYRCRRKTRRLCNVRPNEYVSISSITGGIRFGVIERKSTWCWWARANWIMHPRYLFQPISIIEVKEWSEDRTTN